VSGGVLVAEDGIVGAGASVPAEAALDAGTLDVVDVDSEDSSEDVSLGSDAEGLGEPPHAISTRREGTIGTRIGNLRGARVYRVPRIDGDGTEMRPQPGMNGWAKHVTFA
jgi:hypothetical protein